MQAENFYTYIYYDPSRNNEPIYVGKGNANRAWGHLKSNKKHPFIHRLKFMKKGSISPIIGIYAAIDEEFALFLEVELIAKYGRKDLGVGPLLNLTDGGEGMSGNIRSVETRAKIGKANLAKDRTSTVATKLKISKACKGRLDSDNTKHKKSLANSGINNNKSKLSEQQVVEIFLSTDSLSTLSARFNISKSHIHSIKHRIYWKSITKDLP